MNVFPHATTTYLHNGPVFVEHHLARTGRGLNRKYVYGCTFSRTDVTARELMQRSTAVQRAHAYFGAVLEQAQLQAVGKNMHLLVGMCLRASRSSTCACMHK